MQSGFSQAPNRRILNARSKLCSPAQMKGGEFHASEILTKCPSKYTQDKIDVTEAKAKSASI